jgi:transposase InsO family protein
VKRKENWALESEIKLVIEYKRSNMEEGYRRLSYQMIDLDIVYLSPTTVYRILVKAGLNTKWTKEGNEPKKRGFEQPKEVHEQWHTDISYIKFGLNSLYLICVLDGYSRAILAWDIRERMETYDVQIVLWSSCNKWIFETSIRPRIITDNGSQFVSSEFKEALRENNIKHTRTSVNHPQSNGKIERFHKTAKEESLRKMPKFTIVQMREEFGQFIEYYNTKRLHSAIGYVAPYDVINGKREEIMCKRKEKLKKGREERISFFQKNTNLKG